MVVLQVGFVFSGRFAVPPVVCLVTLCCSTCVLLHVLHRVLHEVVHEGGFSSWHVWLDFWFGFELVELGLLWFFSFYPLCLLGFAGWDLRGDVGVRGGETGQRIFLRLFRVLEQELAGCYSRPVLA